MKFYLAILFILIFLVSLISAEQFYNNCDSHHYCADGTCKLNDSNYNFGLVYIYSDEENYNPSWEKEFIEIIKKVEQATNEISDKRLNISIQLIGESKTEVFSWNPAKLGVRCDNVYYPLPGSSFDSISTEYSCESIEVLDCDKCKLERVKIPAISEGNKTCSLGVKDWETPAKQCNLNFKPFFCNGGTGELIVDCTRCGCDQEYYCDKVSGKCKAKGYENLKDYRVFIDRENSLYSKNFWGINTPLTELNPEIENKLNFKFEDYDGVFIIFGRLGTPSPEETHFYDYKCWVADGIIGGYSNLMMGEDSIMSGGLIDCEKFGPKGTNEKFYYKTGWHTMVHEILHRLGAVDVYETGTTFGIISEREKSLIIDPRTDESIMGNDEKKCMLNFSCSADDLNSVYLDKYNRFNIGLNVNIIGMTEDVISILKDKNKCEVENKTFPEYSEGNIDYSYGDKISEEHYLENESLVLKKGEALACDNNFECASNICTDNQCAKEKLFRKLLNWLKGLF